METKQNQYHPQMYYLKGLTNTNPKILMRMQTSHVMILFFFIDGLHILAKDHLIDQSQKKNELVSYIKGLQLPNGSFTCSSFYTGLSVGQQTTNRYELGHIVFTYSAINSLKILGVIDSINKQQVLQSIKACKRQDGSFSCFPNTTQSDLRFVYSALAVCKIFNDLTLADKQKTKSYIDSCFNYDGGFGLRPGCQSHSGAIFCAVAAYEHLGLQFPTKMKERILNFLVNRQSTQVQNIKIVGVQGRVGKLPDSCYSFWAGASIKILTKGINLLNQHIENFIRLCFKQKQQSFSKYPTSKGGDPVHTFHSVLGLKILKGEEQNIILSQLLRKQ